MSVFFGLFSLCLGAGAFCFSDPAGIPVFGLAFAGAGALREARGAKRASAYALLTISALICAFGVFRALHLFK